MITRHHTFFERGWYTSPLDKVFRGYQGFVVPLPLEVHRDLHAIIKAPIKPNAPTMRGILDTIEKYKPEDHEAVLLHTVAFLEAKASRTENELDSRILQRIGSNLLSQCEIMFNWTWSE